MIRKILQQNQVITQQFYQQNTFQKVFYNFSYIINKGYLLPEPPKQTPTAYQLYLLEKKKNLKPEENKDFMKIIAKDYNNDQIDQDLKQKFQRQAKELREARQVMLERYNDDYGIPKRPVHTYSLYYQEQFQNYKGQNILDIAKQISNDYKKLNKTQLQSLNSKCEKIKKEYKQTLNKYNQEHKIPFVQKKQAKTVFALENPKLTPGQVDYKWDKLTQKQEQEYKDKSAKDYEQQQQNFLDFLNKHKLTEKQFEKLYKKHQKKQLKKRESKKSASEQLE